MTLRWLRRHRKTFSAGWAAPRGYRLCTGFLVLLVAFLLLVGCSTIPPDSCAGFNAIPTHDILVRGSQAWAEWENAVLKAVEERDSVVGAALLDRTLNILTPEMARSIAGHNLAFTEFCQPGE